MVDSPLATKSDEQQEASGGYLPHDLHYDFITGRNVEQHLRADVSYGLS